MNQGASDENERMYRQKVVTILERIASKLEEPAPSASTNNARDVIALIVEEHAKVRSTKGYAVTSFYNAVTRILFDYSRATTPVA